MKQKQIGNGIVIVLLMAFSFLMGIQQQKNIMKPLIQQIDKDWIEMEKKCNLNQQ